MADEPKKKGFLGKLGDALSNRDEKAAAEAAKGEAEKARLVAEAAKKQAAQADAEMRQMKAKAEADAKAKAEEAEKKAKLESLMAQQERARAAAGEAAKQAAAAAAAAKAVKVLKEHTIAPGETLSHLANHFYGHATAPYWKLIMEANKEVGDDPMDFKPGKVIKIPELPEDMK